MSERPQGEAAPRSPFVTGGTRFDSSDAVRELLAAGEHQHSFDSLPAFAAQLLGTASAHVALVSEVQTVVSATGASSEAPGRTVPAEESLCALVAATGEVVAIDDTALDPRAQTVPEVRSGAIRSYLGVPLSVRNQVVGALCVFDAARHTWTAGEIDILQRLAAPVTAELELTALGIDYQNERVLWQLAVDAAGVGAFDWNLETDELRWDERLLEIFGLDVATFGGDIAAFNECVHPDDRDLVTRALNRAIDSCGTYAAEYRINRPDGSVRWISARGRALAGPGGAATRVLGAAYDTTSAEEGEASVRRVLEAMPSAFFHLDRDWRFSYLNSHAARILGGVGVEITGKVLWELFPDTVGSEFERQYRDAVETGQPVHFEAYYPPPLDSWYEVRAWPSPDGLAVYFVDVTDLHAAQQLTELTRQRNELLNALTEALAGTLNAEAAAAALAQVVVGPLADWSVVSLIDHASATSVDPGTDGAHHPADWRRGLRDVATWHVVPERLALVERYTEHRIAALSDSSFVARVLSTHERVVIERQATDQIARVLRPGPGRDALTVLGPGSAAVAPLRARGRTLGLLTVFRDEAREGFSDDELQLLAEVADRAGLTLDNARLYGEQRELAEGLQRILLTDPHDSPYLEMSACYSPAAEQAQVGGDWYDAFGDGDRATCIVIGDVAGHDTEAAAAMGQLRGLLRGVAVSTDEGPSGILRRVDHAMRTLGLDTTATAVVARAVPIGDPGSGEVLLTWSNAGHPPPVVFRSARPDDAARAELLVAASDLLLGVEPGSERSEGAVTLRPGDGVVFYTDGLVERRGVSLDDGFARLVHLLPDLLDDDQPWSAVAARLVAELLPSAPEDDAALIAVRVRRQTP